MGSINKLCGWFGLLFVVSSIVSFIGFSGNALAVSIYDNAYRSTDQLIVSNEQCDNGSAINVTSDWVGRIGDEIGGTGPARQAFNEALAGNDLFIVSQVYNNTNPLIGANHRIEITFYENSNDQLRIDWLADSVSVTPKWQDEYPYEVPAGFKQHGIGIYMDYNDCEVKVGYSYDEYGYQISIANYYSAQDWYENYFTKGITDPNYPDDYEGSPIKDVNPADIPEKENLYPHFTYLVNDKEIKATHDLTQQLPDLPEPDEGWQNNDWQVMWYLFKCSSIDEDDIIACPDRESVHSKLLHRDEIYEWEVDDYGDYLLTAEFRYQSCLRSPSWPETPDYCYLNSEHDEYSFVPGRTVPLFIDGNNIFGNTADLNCDVAGNCYDDTRFKNCNVIVAIATLSFDDFNYADCLENISLLANMLSFDTIRFSNSWVSNGNCYTLGTLGNWLNLSNKHVCPYFSNEVRNTITPFITFILGLIMVRFIAGKGEHGSREVDI